MKHKIIPSLKKNIHSFLRILSKKKNSFLSVIPKGFTPTPRNVMDESLIKRDPAFPQANYDSGNGVVRGFTLIELLVVISIIGLVASVILIGVSVARRKARDAKRLSDITQVKTALELYFNTNYGYPAAASAIPLQQLVGITPTYLINIPLDTYPADNGCGFGFNYLSTTPSAYTITFCLGGQVGPYAGGTHTLIPSQGIQ